MSKSVTTLSFQNQSPLLGLFDPNEWRKKRAEYIQAGRDCKAALTNPAGYWNYAPNDPRVKAAVDCWLHRARNAHAFALGRQPVIAKVVSISNGTACKGPIYATESEE